MEHCKRYQHFRNVVKSLTEEELKKILTSDTERLHALVAVILLGEDVQEYTSHNEKTDGREDDWECDLAPYLFSINAKNSSVTIQQHTIKKTYRPDMINDLTLMLIQNPNWVTVSINSFYDHISELHTTIIHYYE